MVSMIINFDLSRIASYEAFEGQIVDAVVTCK